MVCCRMRSLRVFSRPSPKERQPRRSRGPGRGVNLQHVDSLPLKSTERGGTIIGTVRKRGKNWYVDYAASDGRRVVKRVGPDRKQAEAVLSLRMADVVAGRDRIPTESKATFSQYAEEWLRLHAPD